MIPQNTKYKRCYDIAFAEMMMLEQKNSNISAIVKHLTTFIDKNKSEFSDVKAAKDIVKSIKTKNLDSTEIIGLIADLSNTIKDSSKFEKELEKVIDMVL